MANPLIVEYINKKLSAGVDKDSIISTLQKDNWKIEDIQAAFTEIANTPKENLENIPQPMGSFSINLSNSLVPSFAVIKLFSNEIIIQDVSKAVFEAEATTPKIIPVRNIQNIQIKPNWFQMSYKILIQYLRDPNTEILQFSCGDSLSVNLYNTVYLYKALLELKQTGSCDLLRLQKGFWEDRIPIPIILAGIIILPCLPIILGTFHIQIQLPSYIVDLITYAAMKIGAALLLIPMLIGGALFAIPVGLIYIYRLRKIIYTINQPHMPRVS
jgi:hypothetical protein